MFFDKMGMTELQFMEMVPITILSILLTRLKKATQLKVETIRGFSR
jgi:hypothetical protein